MPRKDHTECSHSVLSFGSGDFYVICNECQLFWAPENKDDYADVGRTVGGVRVDPEAVNASKSQLRRVSIQTGICPICCAPTRPSNQQTHPVEPPPDNE